ncbi:MAG: AmmeMemoRadiSam system radical SAM enzyme [Deltaproteobacteria bacterium]|nr:AmmeMemoRadiSam system radical SAM enzyme [Deltaproteobacteria bacterium]
MTTSATHKARFFRPLDDRGRIVCELCPRHCTLRPGQRAFCFVRENVDGQMVLTTYGRSTGFCIDPIEKKPLNHFYPGTSVLSFGTAGCNLGCRFCQNWDISKAQQVEVLSQSATPQAIAETAKGMGCTSVAFTYNDPVIFAEYAIDTAIACRALGIKSLAVTAGYISEAAREPFFAPLDAANVDLKAFADRFYRKLCFAELAPVLETLRYLRHKTSVWIEITTLLIPGQNDSQAELDALCGWLHDELGPETPLHLTAFHPDFKMTEVPKTPHATLQRAREQALTRGLKHVYTGNVDDAAGQSTYCAGCGTLLIERNWYTLGRWRLDDDRRCLSCGRQLAGHFSAQPGNWGARRQPIRMER